jgi:hypothetical protein
MHRQLEHRLTQLKTEYQTGQCMLAELEQKQRDLRDTILRISGAIQVLEEELSHTAQNAPVEVAQPNGVALHLNTEQAKP